MTRPVTDIMQYMSPLMLQSTHQVWRFLQGCLLKKMLKRQSPPMGNITSPRVSKNTALLLQHHYENDLLYSASDKQLQFLLISLNHGDKNVIATFAHIFKKLHCLKDWQRFTYHGTTACPSQPHSKQDIQSLGSKFRICHIL